MDCLTLSGLKSGNPIVGDGYLLDREVSPPSCYVPELATLARTSMDPLIEGVGSWDEVADGSTAPDNPEQTLKGEIASGGRWFQGRLPDTSW